MLQWLEHFAPQDLDAAKIVLYWWGMEKNVLNALQSELIRRRSKNPQYSTRAFAKFLGISSGALSELLSGKRPLGPHLEQKLKPRLGLFDREALPKENVNMGIFETIRRRESFLVLAALRLKKRFSSAERLAEFLDLPPVSAQRALKNLTGCDLIKKNSQGFFRRTPRNIEAPDEIASLALRQAHQEALEAAQKALDEIPMPSRDFTIMYTVANPTQLAEVKKRIRNFEDELCNFLECSTHDKNARVYQLSIQFFPVSSKGV